MRMRRAGDRHLELEVIVVEAGNSKVGTIRRASSSNSWSKIQREQAQ